MEITDSWGVKISDAAKQWDDFKKLCDSRPHRPRGTYGKLTVHRQETKIVSFGGWGYSTEPVTHDKIRQATNPANRAAFAANVVNFVIKHNLDGVDFDWVYATVHHAVRATTVIRL